MGFSSVRKKLSPPIPARLKSQAVRVVPTFEPITTPKVSQKSTMPEFTRPTSITVIAEDDCMAMVIPAPRKKLKWVSGDFFQGLLQCAAGQVVFKPARKH